MQPKKPKMKNKTIKLFALVISTLALAGGLRAAPPTVADVGDVDSFGHNAQYMGASSGFITLTASCTPAPSPTPNDQCFNINPAPATTTFTANEICRIKLPKKATRTIIYPVFNFFTNYQLQNSTGVAQPQGLVCFHRFDLDLERCVAGSQYHRSRHRPAGEWHNHRPIQLHFSR